MYSVYQLEKLFSILLTSLRLARNVTSWNQVPVALSLSLSLPPSLSPSPSPSLPFSLSPLSLSLSLSSRLDAQMAVEKEHTRTHNVSISGIRAQKTHSF